MTVDLQPGSVFGDYVLERRLGGGGFGDVWLSRDASGALVALKVLHGQYQNSEAAKLRAEIELLAAAASAQSSHIVRVLGGGSAPAPYVVMEYIDGVDLGSEIARRGALPVAEVMRIAEGVADALATLQQAGIIHRDIKPANVMINADGEVKLTDFGIAKIVGVDSITTTNQIAMSVAYAAPEAFDGKVSYLSDHYAFGALLYHCLTGRTLFAGSYIEIMRHQVATLPDLRVLPRDTPTALVHLISACLAKEPQRRPPNATALKAGINVARSALEASLKDTVKRSRLQEPIQLGPWVIDARVEDDAWTFQCHDPKTGESAEVEVHFANELAYGESLRNVALGAAPEGWRAIGTSRLVLRPGESWPGQPLLRFLFWIAWQRVPDSNQVPRDVERLATLVPSKGRGSKSAILICASLLGLVGAVVAGLYLTFKGGASGGTDSAQALEGRTLSQDTLLNMSYVVSGKPDRFVNGKSTSTEPGFTGIVDGTIAIGDLNSDGTEDAVLVIAANGGGSGVFMQLALVLNKNGAARNTSVYDLGDRVQIIRVSIESGVITVDMSTHAPVDSPQFKGLCCPNIPTTWQFRVSGNDLVKTSALVQSPVALGSTAITVTPTPSPTSAPPTRESPPSILPPSTLRTLVPPTSTSTVPVLPDRMDCKAILNDTTYRSPLEHTWYLTHCYLLKPTPPPMSPSSILVGVSSASVGCSGAAFVTVTVRDPNGSYVADGTQVTFQTTLGTMSPTSAGSKGGGVLGVFTAPGVRAGALSSRRLPALQVDQLTSKWNAKWL